MAGVSAVWLCAAAIAGSLLWSTATRAEDPAPAAHEAQTPAPDAEPTEPKSDADTPKKRRRPRKPAAEATPAPKPAETAGPDDPLVEQLGKAGVKNCLSGMATMGKETLSGVSSYGRAANWQLKTPDQRVASIILGQSYPQGAPLPKAFAVVIGSPAGSGKCDSYAVQVIPTKEKCSDLQTKISVRGKKLGELSGIPFLNDVNKSQIMLLPSAGDACVLVALRIRYAE